MLRSLTITQGSFSRLQPGVWICDETIDFFCGGVLQLEMNNNGTHFYTAHFVSTLISLGMNLGPWHSKALQSCGIIPNIFELKRLFFPIHKDGNHWLFIMVDISSKVTCSAHVQPVLQHRSWSERSSRGLASSSTSNYIVSIVVTIAIEGCQWCIIPGDNSKEAQ